MRGRSIPTLVAAACALAAIYVPSTSSALQAPTRIKIGEGVERSIGGSQTHSYVVKLQKGQFVRFVADQRGVDVVVRVFDPSGKALGVFDSPNADKGPEPATIITQSAGDYRFDVTPLMPAAPQGKYEAKLVEVRAATNSEISEARVIAEVKQADAAWEDAVGKADPVALERLVGDEYRNLESAARPGKRAWVENVKTTAKPQPPKEIGLLVVHPFGEVVIVTSRVTFKPQVNGREVRNSIRVVHVWKKQGGRWQIVGDLTYPAPGDPEPRTAIKVGRDILQASAGTYVIAPLGPVTVKPNDEGLSLETPGGKAELLPESEADFFAPAGNLQVTFVRDSKGVVTHAIFVADGRAFRAPKTR